MFTRGFTQLTKEYFFFIKDVTPSDVFAGATVGHGGHFANACRALGIETLLCRAHRINSSVMWMLGIAGAASKCQNPAMKEIIQKAAHLVGVFSHSAVNQDALREVQNGMAEDELAEMEELACAAEEMQLAQREIDAAAALVIPSEWNAPKCDIVSLSRRPSAR